MSFPFRFSLYTLTRSIEQIWDLGGQREFVSMLPLVSNDAVAILFMFDLTRKSTLNSIKEWYRQARGFNKVRPTSWSSWFSPFSWSLSCSITSRSTSFRPMTNIDGDPCPDRDQVRSIRYFCEGRTGRDHQAGQTVF
jgi:hypothetical protein